METPGVVKRKASLPHRETDAPSPLQRSVSREKERTALYIVALKGNLHLSVKLIPNVLNETNSHVHTN
jgi:hypothetical protein